MDYTQPWYHGSPFALTTLRVGSTITQRRDLARIFSHKPAIVCIEDDGRIKHNGTQPGYLYIIDEAVAPEDVEAHPRTTMGPGDEWLTHRELRVRLLDKVEPCSEELLTPEELDDLHRRIAARRPDGQ
ncbi:MAG TPA: hypothetical protein PKZ84_19620 [Anaerolineae bacterium]|nr:hypothetical protein [Anaerolineae bacterium]HQI86858.1 hypothetical protein [Anaerolineae bacterium]